MLSRKMFSVLKKEGWIISWNSKVSYLWNYMFNKEKVIDISSNCNDLDIIEEIKNISIYSNDNNEKEICNRFLRYFIGGNKYDN